ncbi:2Fe-2S ferredoxin-type domain-containing protein, partial [Dimargaris cristalligena]
LMEVAQAHGIELEACCGGQCECATCHLIVENIDEYKDHLPPVSEAEEDMLEYAPGCEARSRLSCQIPVTAALDGIRLRVP